MASAFNLLNGQRIAVDGDEVFVVYTEQQHGWECTMLRWYNGTAWSDPMYVAGDTRNANEPDIVAQDGVAHIVYTDYNDRDADVVYRTFSNGAFGNTVQVSNPIAFATSQDPAIAIEPDGDVHVVWEDLSDGDSDILYRGTIALRWGAIQDVTLGTASEVDPDVAYGDRKIHVVYSGDVLSDWDIYYTYNMGTGWQRGIEISHDTRNDIQGHPSMALMGTKIQVSYEQLVGMFNRIYIVTYDGRWSQGTQISSGTANTNYYLPRIDTEDDNTVLVYRSFQGVISKALLRYNNGTEWADEMEVSGGDTRISFQDPDAVLVDGDAHVTWYGSSLAGYSVYYRRTLPDTTPPQARVEPIVPYWMDGGRMLLDWTATDDRDLSQVTLQFRYSTDNATWGRWTVVGVREGLNGTSTQGSMSFTPTDGDGFYEFKAWARDAANNTEPPTTLPEAMGGIDTADPTGSIVINGGDEFTTNSTVSLALTFDDTTSGVAKVRFADEAIGGDEPWENPVSTKEWTIGTDEGEHTVAYQIMDLSGRLSREFTDTIYLDIADPYGTITMTLAEEWTTTREVGLTLTYGDSGSGVSMVRFADEAVGGDEPWENPVETRMWTLPEGEGMHTIAYQVLDAAGRTSEVYTVSVGLDTVAPTGSIIIGGVDTVTTERTVTLTLTAEDETSGVAGIRVLNEAVGGDEPWENPVETLEWELTAGSGEKTVRYQVVDEAGLTSPVYTAIITLDVDVPTGTIALTTGALLINTATVSLDLSFADDTSAIAGIRIQEDAIGGDEPWENPVENMEFTLSTGDGEKTIYFQIVDAAGQESQVYSVSVTLDTSNPYVENTDPLPLAEKVPVNQVITVRFSEIMDRNSVERAFTLSFLDGGVPNNVAGTFNWSSDGKSLTFTPL
ncbi:MAG: Ig-like domain-containing protein, partial [Thermoplasmata archaeon]